MNVPFLLRYSGSSTGSGRFLRAVVAILYLSDIQFTYLHLHYLY